MLNPIIRNIIPKIVYSKIGFDFLQATTIRKAKIREKIIILSIAYSDNIHIKNVITYEDEILKSAVLTATIVNKIADVGEAITIPNDYKIDNTNDSWNNGYLKWKNVYDK